MFLFLKKAIKNDKKRAQELSIPYYNARPEMNLRLIANMIMQAANGSYSYDKDNPNDDKDERGQRQMTVTMKEQ